MRRRICYVTGTRADFGLMEPTLRAIHANHSQLELFLCVTGMHLSPKFGLTVSEVEATELPISARLPVDLSSGDGASMARAIGVILVGLTDVFRSERADCVLVLGDRGEMLAAALAAVHLNIPIMHIGGGDRSGSVDDAIRHAITKLSHYHCVSTTGARDRLIRMGECPERIFVTGAPGLDGLRDLSIRSRSDLCIQRQLTATDPIALVVFHPVVQEAQAAGNQIKEVLEAVTAERLQALCVMPNSDAGNDQIREVLLDAHADGAVRLVTHLPRAEFISWMAVADLMIGNSSCGIVESTTFGLPVVNVGDRQRDRERNGNVIDCRPYLTEIRAAINRARTLPRHGWVNIYGSGQAAARITSLLASLSLDSGILMKSNTY